jgi:NTE family protein
VLDIGAADFTQRASAILEGEKAALAAMPLIRARVAQLQAAREEATRLAQRQAAEAQHQACLEQRSRLQKLAGMAGLEGGCPAP